MPEIAKKTEKAQKEGAEVTDTTARALLLHLVCPVTKGPLIYDAASHQLISPQIKKAFPIRHGVPILLVDEALDIEES